MVKRDGSMRFELSDAEWKVMNAVWRKHPASVREVIENLENAPGWAYTTVKTMLGRLAEKGILSVEKTNNTSYYEPLVTRAQARRNALERLIERAFDGAFGPMLHFLVNNEKLSEQDKSLVDDYLKSSGELPPQSATGEHDA